MLFREGQHSFLSSALPGRISRPRGWVISFHQLCVAPDCPRQPSVRISI
nr:MAG TPA: hypothetical protein [Caudoviricetes sp.]